MADGGHVGDREQFWRDHITGWKSSGMSLRLYSEEHGLKAGTLGSWNSRLKAQAAPVDDQTGLGLQDSAEIAARLGIIRLDGDRLAVAVERCLVAAEHAGVAHGLRLPGQEVKPGSGEVHKRRCLEALALC